MLSPEVSPIAGQPVAIDGHVGTGGFATTWSARVGTRDVIVKVAHRAGGTSFVHEHAVLGLLAGTSAPVPLAHGWLADGRAYLVMTRTAGTPLSRILAESGPL